MVGIFRDPYRKKTYEKDIGRRKIEMNNKPQWKETKEYLKDLWKRDPTEDEIIKYLNGQE